MQMTTQVTLVRATLAEVGPIVVGLTLALWWVLAFRVLGGVDADYGGFVSISERLLAGDRLYADVYENKDPLFHYAFASSRLISPLGSWALSIVWMLVGASATWVLGRQLGLPRRSAFFLAGIATPLLLTGASYFPSASHIPGVVMTLVAMAAALRGRWVIAGLAVAAVVGLKVIMAPMAVALVIAVVIYRRSPRALVPAVGGVAGGLALIVATLILRGELLPYVDNLRLNTVYSQAAAGGAQGVAAIRSHLDLVLDESNLSSLLGMALAVLLAWALASTAATRSRAVKFALVTALGALVYALIVIAATGLWGHHGLILIVPVLLAFTALLLALPKGLVGIPLRALPFLLLITWVLAGAPTPRVYLESLEYARANIQSHLTMGDEARAIAGSGSPTTYMRVGNAREAGHAFGLREWTLACPRILQEVWESEELLTPTLECLPNAEVILISKEVEPMPEFPAWSAYVQGVEALVAAEYTCTDVDAGRVCRRVGA